jgi:hypothetical protein
MEVSYGRAGHKNCMIQITLILHWMRIIENHCLDYLRSLRKAIVKSS